MASSWGLRCLLLLCSGSSLLSSAAAASSAASSWEEGKCGTPKLVENAQILKSSNPIMLRYSCVKNYKRKAGTSSLSVCKEDGQWTEPNIACIRDPTLPTSRTESMRTEAKTSTPAAPKMTDVSPSLGSTQPYGSTATSPPALHTSSAWLGTAKPSPDRPTMMRTTMKVSRCTSPHTVTKRITLPQRTTTPVLQARTSETPKAGNGSTTAPPETSAPWKQTGSVITIGLPILAFLFLILLFFCYRRRRSSQRAADLPLPEESPMTDMASIDPDDPGSSNEGDPVLPSNSAISTG
ncbi:interleukin-15 receptor subunit alpha [Sceloporus undulatus]|uniref:interleukin-15 receptor subunit alpha n=1 Tax=Sceloporus undulatus TaxID=8520 RepID=UPI001C4AC3E8|nr:interleukin-15 receptor subunit alpha [Sceloporus undulatus]